MTLRFDDEVDPERRRRLLWAMPAGLYVLGTRGGDAGYHCMTQSLVTQAATAPCVLALAIERAAKTHALLDAAGAGALSVLRRDQRALVRRFVKPDLRVEVDDRGELVAIEDVAMATSPSGLPVVADALGALELAVLDQRTFESHTLFLLEVVAVAVDDVVLEGPASARVAEVLRMEDTKMNYGG